MDSSMSLICHKSFHYTGVPTNMYECNGITKLSALQTIKD